ncbi:hypothetical protein RUM43_006760 [Polyplax serrata]
MGPRKASDFARSPTAEDSQVGNLYVNMYNLKRVAENMSGGSKERSRVDVFVRRWPGTTQTSGVVDSQPESAFGCSAEECKEMS